jgi:hypothetical protein
MPCTISFCKVPDTAESYSDESDGPMDLILRLLDPAGFDNMASHIQPIVLRPCKPPQKNFKS